MLIRDDLLTRLQQPQKGEPMNDQVRKVVTVIHLSNGVPFHSWVIGLPYFSLELTPEVETEAETKQPKTVN